MKKSENIASTIEAGAFSLQSTSSNLQNGPFAQNAEKTNTMSKQFNYII